MSVIINTATVKTLLPGTTDDQINIYDGIFDDAEQCLSAYPFAMQDLVVALAVAHMIEMSSGGSITSETTRQGASASYGFFGGKGLESTRYGQQLLGLPAGQCIIGIFAQPLTFARSINPCR
tara:strand:+ start:1318 stop:1683 length:366 start_codon:yes stop_codon:yes gene_type:complete